MKILICGVGGRMGREVAKMALWSVQLRPDLEEIPLHVSDKHFLRKHGPNAYYGQKAR